MEVALSVPSTKELMVKQISELTITSIQIRSSLFKMKIPQDKDSKLLVPGHEMTFRDIHKELWQ